MSTLVRSSLLAASLAVGVAAQDLELSVTGGSMPGQIDLSLSGGAAFQQAGLVLLSVTTGPTPLALLDPTDPRVLRVGLELAGLAQSGPFVVGGVFQPASIPVPNLPSILDKPLYFQGLSVPGNPRLIDKVSLPRAVRFGPAGGFRDRFVTFASPRSFFPILPGSDGRVLLAGGGAGTIFAQIARKDTEWFDPIADSFSPGPDMTIERSLHTATRLGDGRYLLVGGVDRNNDPQTTAEIWDPIAGTFTGVANMTVARMGHSATLLPNGRVLVAGGITDLNAPSTPVDPIYSITTSTELYDPATNRWTAGPVMRRPRAGQAAITRADGKLLLAGGVSWTTFIVRLPTVEASSDLYDPAANTIAAGPTLRQSRAQCTTAALGGGRWLLAGGVGTISLTQQGTPTAAAEIYDEAANTFTATRSMAQQRTLHDVFPLGGGRFLHAGGGDGTLFALVPLASAEIYDVATGVWTPGPALHTARAAYGAYRTATGQWQVLGGDTPTGVDFSTEFYYR